MSFAVPDFLWLALLGPIAAAAAAWRWRSRLAADAAWAARGLWDRLLPAYEPRRLALSVVTLALAVLGTSLALARPRWGSEQQKVERKGVDVVFLVDSSLSMGALDVPPSRLFVAKSLVRRMVEAMPGNRVGLVQTEGDGVVLAPLTLDGAVIDLLLDTIDPGSLPTPGTELATGLETALRLFGEGTEKHRVLVMLSDGEDHGGGLDTEVSRLRDEGVTVFGFGIGTPAGARVPIPGSAGEFKREADGSIVISQLHEELLEKLARATGGSYVRVTSAAVDPAPFLRQIDRMEKRTLESESLSTQEERFQWPLALAALALILHLAVRPFRGLTSQGRLSPRPEPSPPGPLSRPRPSPLTGRGGNRPVMARASLLPTLLLLSWAALPDLPWKPHLPSWVERWLYNPRERVERSIAASRAGEPREAVGPADTALRLAPNDSTVQYDAGTAHLRAGHARKAVGLLEKAAKGASSGLSVPAHYNLGNARLAAGDAAGAVEAYKTVLRAEPGHENAKYNLELALREEQKQKMGLSGRPAGSRGNRSQNRDPSDQPGRGKAEQNPSRPEDSQRSGESQSAQGQNAGAPQFRNQPEMSAREAAAVLSAVENLERQQRRDQAARRAKQQAAKGKDW
jgi:Ca-activated chloride channel homolog